MSLKKSNNNDAPIFDKPAQKKATGFFLRRLMSLAGKPVLAEKNLPISPSTDELAEKCYVCKMALLYRQQKVAAARLDFKPTVKGYAVPQHSNFDHPERFHSELNCISANVAKLKTVFANRALDTLVPIKISKHHQRFAERFDTHIKATTAYSFAPTTLLPELIGTHAELNSIKLAETCNTITESALFSGFKRRLNWQPQGFSYPDSQLIFNSQFPDTASDFFRYLPEPCNFALFPGNYGFLPAVQTVLCHIEHIFGKQRFVTQAPKSAPKSAANFDSRSEFARNLVILCNSSLSPVEGNASASHAKPQDPGLSLEVCNRPLNPMPQHRKHLQCLLSEVVARTKASPQIISPALRNLKFAPGLQATSVTQKKGQFAGTMLLNLACQASRSRLKLRLSLKHADYSKKVPMMQTLIHHQIFQSRMPLPAKIANSYLPLILAEPSKKLVMRSKPEVCPSYAARRSSMRFTANRHAKYCRKALKTIFEARTAKISENQANTDSRYCVASTLSKAQRFSERFASSKLCNEAINAIYLRSMPFLMKLSAMHFTDIFLPDAKRRAVPATTSFCSDLAPLPLRRRNTLKSLRFKLTRINDGYVAASLRARRRILQPAETFRINDARTAIKITEPTRLPAGTGEKFYNPGYRGRLTRFALSDRLPAQITDQLKLSMEILDNTQREDLPQRHFIHPATWEKTTRPHKCRVILAPHPFGFPHFRLSIDNFQLVESSISFKLKLPTPSHLATTSNCSFSSDRQHLPPLSLKNPRRFLFAENRESSVQPVSYYARKEFLRDKFSVPAKIETFAHEWGLKKTRKLATTIFHRLPALRARQKATAEFASVSESDCYQLIPPRQEFLHFFTPRIKHLLLSFNKFLGAAQPATALLNSSPTRFCNPQRFIPSMQLPATESFRQPASAFSFKMPCRTKFDEKFSAASTCKSMFTAFLHRPRFFMFPYQPEYTSAELGIDFRKQEEPLLDRLTFFDQTGMENCCLVFAGLVNPPGTALSAQMTRSKSSQPESFVNKFARNGSHLFSEHAGKAEVRLDYEREQCRQQIDDSAFKKIVDVARLKLRKYKHIRSQITGYLATKLLPPRDSFSNRTGSRIPQRLSCDNLHWVILLRSFIVLPMPEKNLFNAKKADCAEPGISALTASFSCTFRSGLADDFSDSLRPAREIDRYALSTLPDTRIFIEANQKFTCSGTCFQEAFAPACISSASYTCIDAECDFTMCITERPDYRRNIELYILHMAIDIDDYKLDTGVYVRPFAEQPAARTARREEYHQPHIPEWFDLPQPMVHRARIRI